ncbi:transglutaminase domain-containing protein [Fibrella sp. WM1]|uniref:transglutaminase domain-containing protein n=1 Tax=Fibrella musci TaxID=3242485 RepID=UPI003522DAAE
MQPTLPAFRVAFVGLLVSLCSIHTQAQQAAPIPVVKFGQVTAADFTVKPTPVDTTAEAVVLYESANTRFSLRNQRILRQTDYYSKIRINKKSAYDRATIEMALHGDGPTREYVQNIEGATYTLQNGQVTKQKMDKAAVVNERVSNTLTVQKLTLPGVQEGCIIEYRYTRFSPDEETPPSWAFQQDIPVIWSDYKSTLSNYYHVKVIMMGYLPLTVHKSTPVSGGLVPGIADEGAVESHYAVANAPAFKNEAYITTPRDYLSRIDFELASINIPGYLQKAYSLSWSDMDQTLLGLESFANQYQKAPYLRSVADGIKAKYPVADTLGRVTAAYDYLRNAMTWNGQGNVQSDRLKKVLEQKKGDAADLNFMLIGLLRELGLNANPVILSTRDHGQINESYGMLRQFNYVVSHLTLGGKDFLLDATDRFVRPGVLPYRALNKLGRLILPNGNSRFVPLTTTERDTEAKIGAFTVSEDGELKGTLSHSYSGYGAIDARESYKSRGEKQFVDDVKQKKPDWQVEQVSFTNVSELDRPLTVNYTLTVAEVAQVVGDRMYLRPMLTEGQQENPFKQPERQYPVDFAHGMETIFTTTYTLPAGYTVEEMPKPVIISLPDKGGRFAYQVQSLENRITVVSRVLISKPLFMADEYGVLKEFYEKILQKHGEQIVLKKSGSAPIAEQTNVPTANPKSGSGVTPRKK